MIVPLTRTLTAWLRDPVTGVLPLAAARPPATGEALVPPPTITDVVEAPEYAAAVPADDVVTEAAPLILVGQLLEDGVQLGGRLVDEVGGQSSVGLAVLVVTRGGAARTEYLHGMHLARCCERVIRDRFAATTPLELPDVAETLAVQAPTMVLTPIRLEGTDCLYLQLALRFDVLDRWAHAL